MYLIFDMGFCFADVLARKKRQGKTPNYDVISSLDLVWVPFASITVSVQYGNDDISLWYS